MEGKIVNYRGGKRTQYSNQMVITLSACKNKEDASKLVGSKIEWTTSTNKKIIGRVSRAHGNNGCVLARFNKGLPGQSIGTGIKIIEKPE
jgi:large subunit ribosomal protein L35Ae